MHSNEINLRKMVLLESIVSQVVWKIREQIQWFSSHGRKVGKMRLIFRRVKVKGWPKFPVKVRCNLQTLYPKKKNNYLTLDNDFIEIEMIYDGTEAAEYLFERLNQISAITFLQGYNFVVDYRPAPPFGDFPLIVIYISTEDKE